ncbi:MAG TPA: arginine repressor [Thermoanaerobaculia bacterium]|nr:arginine repressor [Thermoanaerobaculia bacterium]
MPTDRELREARQRAIRALLARSPVANQAELVAELRRQGIAATQSSVSRDLRDLGVARVGGRYVPRARPEERDPRVAEVARLLRSVRPAGPYLTVVQTAVGAAQGVARALDAAGWPEVVGSLAGDDTVFLATATEQDQERLIRHLAVSRQEAE